MHEVEKSKLAEELRKLFKVKGAKIKPSRFAIYVPTRIGSEDRDIEIHPARHRVLVAMAKQFLSETLGGLTCYKAKGAWIDDKTGRLHEEKVLVMESYCSLDVIVKSAKDLRLFANALAIEFEQTQMACVIDGEMVFFEPTEDYRAKHEWIATKIPPADRKLDSVLWKYVLGPLKDAGVNSVHEEIA